METQPAKVWIGNQEIEEVVRQVEIALSLEGTKG